MEIVDRQGNTIGTAPRSHIHGNPSLIHKVVHILVFNDRGELLLQKRSMKKDVAPGKWDTSVGGHVPNGEDLITAAIRETEEELGITPINLKPLYSYIHSNTYESEMVFTHSCIYNGPFTFNKEEIDEIRFWDMKEIKNAIGTGLLSDNLESEIMKYLSFSDQTPLSSAP
ncbi:NUDIX hydrolase [Dissulfurispira thermophila]|uniref:NUDIX hydrolase n=1 Tax=Dissulfurispira thermophila TaxID=2715679 RepID=A0A7G1H322_9BACT|nr:NUDIX domain-containing protein [Dissulfurispira thermophila]BCB96542.1 NUDIX hydrolase [Dissulfurispira thermophila]